jgi:arabinan endo-1,5-alpha-L-arabinosidase
MNISPRFPATLFLLAMFAGTAWAQVGDLERVHDPCIIQEGDVFYLFTTGNGIPMRRSTDLYHWERIGSAFSTAPKWAVDEFPRAGNQWAPDISHFGGSFHLYYAISRFGRNRSCVGQATNKTLDPKSPEYQWVDQGKVIETQTTDNWNAIDPNVAFDADGTPWLVLGSFWSGIKMRRLDAQTGMLSEADTTLYSVARRPSPDAIEAPFIFRHGDYDYLFLSYDYCCRGMNSTYKTMVGRSKGITGPYVDMSGKPMTDEGATLVVQSQGTTRGPGHCAVISAAGHDWLVHHFYDANNQGRSSLQIRPIVWDADGWPLAGEPISAPVGSQPVVERPELAGTWKLSIDFGDETDVEFQADGGIKSAANNGAKWTLDGHRLTIRWPATGESQTEEIDRCFVSDDGTWYVGRSPKGAIVRGHRAAQEKSP